MSNEPCRHCANLAIAFSDISARTIKNENTLRLLIKKHNRLCNWAALIGVGVIIISISGLQLEKRVYSLEKEVKALKDILEEHIDSVEEGDLDERGD